MKITVIGGGPGGLYFSILTKKARPGWAVEVYERNQADDAFGFGVVFSDETLQEFLQRDAGSYERIRAHFAYWDDLDIARNGETVRIGGNGFCGCSRKTLLNLLQERCREEGVALHFGHEVPGPEAFPDSDLIVVCDGIASAIRTRFAHAFGTRIRVRRNRFVWMGSTRPLDAFCYFFRSTPAGTVVAHTYQYETGRSTWIFEMAEPTWQALGFGAMDEAATTRLLESLFSEELQGHPLITNKSLWRQFPEVRNDHWYHGNMVLLGDAKATAHFSIGSGTKLAMECAIALSDSVVRHAEKDREAAFREYEAVRRPRVEAIQHAAGVSLEWFESMDRHMQHPFYRFAFGVMTRAKKVTWENLRLRDATFTSEVLAEFHRLNQSTDTRQAAALSPLSIAGLQLRNRIAASPHSLFGACEGHLSDFHLVHYGSLATGGAGLVMTETTAVEPEGRITPACPGIWNDGQEEEWRRIAAFIHQYTGAVAGMQLGHAGRKGARLPGEGDTAMAGAWDLISASEIPWKEGEKPPRAMEEADFLRVEKAFTEAARRAERAGFDWLEIQAAQGYLLASFLSPLTNKRTDAYGGSPENRLRFPLRLFSAVRSVWPAEKPLSVCLPACDWEEGGLSEEDSEIIAMAFRNAGASLISVSSGGTIAGVTGPVSRMWQTPLSDRIRNTAGIPTLTEGEIDSIDQANTLILNGRADLIAPGKAMLGNPAWVREAGAWEQTLKPETEPLPYRPAAAALLRIKKEERKTLESMRKALKPGSHKP